MIVLFKSMANSMFHCVEKLFFVATLLWTSVYCIPLDVDRRRSSSVVKRNTVFVGSQFPFAIWVNSGGR